MNKIENVEYRERAILVGCYIRGVHQVESSRSSNIEENKEILLEELKSLASTAGAEVVYEIIQWRQNIDPAYYIGKGKADELGYFVKEYKADLVVFDNDLSPAQVRNLEKVVECKVIDRTELILDIFATHAKTKEAKLQVELAQLKYTLPRLRHMWTHLERIVGVGGAGIGTRGPGEKQLEVDKRLARKKINSVQKEIKRIISRKQTEVAKRAENFTISLVGYTNSGKSTLMNALTNAGVFVENKLFSTLDTKTHIWRLSSGTNVLLSDTVGFIRNIPHHLIASFTATLEEVRNADLLLHIADVSSSMLQKQIDTVENLLNNMLERDIVRILVLNKFDLIKDPIEQRILEEKFPDAVFISALKGEGLEKLDRRVDTIVRKQQVIMDVDIPITDGKLISQVASSGKILEKSVRNGYIKLKVRIPIRDVGRFEKWKVRSK